MKKTTIITLTLLMVAMVFNDTAFTRYTADSIDKLKLVNTDVPEGYVYGKIPGFAQKVLKANPWSLDNYAIRRLTPRIYPGGDYNKIDKIHMTILASRDNPYGDDIVCYIILYRDNYSAKNEIVKINEYVGYNNDRSIVVTRDNMAVYFCVDDITNFHYIRNLADVVESRFEYL